MNRALETCGRASIPTFMGAPEGEEQKSQGKKNY